MKRITLLALGLLSLTWTTGCCCWRHSQCVEWDDECCAAGPETGACGDGGPCVEHDDGERCERCGRRHRRRLARERARDRGRCAPACCPPANCCDPCAGGVPVSGTVIGSGAPVVGSYEPDVMFGGPAGCAGCAGGGHSMSSLPPTSGGCASGNCGGTTPTYGNYGSFPVDSSGGWTIQSTPMPGSSEPVQAPPAGGSSASTRGVVPSPSPIAPVSSTGPGR